MSKIHYTLATIVAAAGIVGALIFSIEKPVTAVSAKDWKAGNILSDREFTDKNAMSVSQIQSFLNKRLANCDPSGSQLSELGGPDYNKDGKVTRAEYGRSIGNPAPFTCLNNYYEVPKTSPKPGFPASNYGGKSIPQGAKSAAQLIYDAAQRYSISPKVLLVKLATESAGPLTGDPWPMKSQYTYVMGARCPDSGPGGSANCDSSYAGFSIQMSEAAKLLRGYLTNMDQSWWPYKKQGEQNYILLNVVERGCGGNNVYIQSKATAALYTYTPYQPNAAALSNMYGTGDRCSAYGNRNFWRVYNDWFGREAAPADTPFYRINGGKAVYIDGVGSSYYHVDNPNKLKAYGYGKTISQITSKSDSHISNRQYKGVLPMIARFEGTAIYGVDRGYQHAFTSRETLNEYGYQVGDEAMLPSRLTKYFSEHSPMRTIASGDLNKTYLITSATKRYFNGPSAYRSGSPNYSALPGTGLSDYFLSKIPSGARVYAPGDLVRVGSSPTVYMIIDANNRIAIPSRAVMNDYGFSFDSVISISVKDAVYYKLSPSSLDILLKSEDESASIVGPQGSVFKVSPRLINESYGFINTNKLLDAPSRVTAILKQNGNLTKLIRAEGQAAVYLVDNGTRRSIKSRQELKSLGYTMENVSDVSRLFLQKIPTR